MWMLVLMSVVFGQGVVLSSGEGSSSGSSTPSSNGKGSLGTSPAASTSTQGRKGFSSLFRSSPKQASPQSSGGVSDSSPTGKGSPGLASKEETFRYLGGSGYFSGAVINFATEKDLNKIRNAVTSAGPTWKIIASGALKYRGAEPIVGFEGTPEQQADLTEAFKIKAGKGKGKKREEELARLYSKWLAPASTSSSPASSGGGTAGAGGQVGGVGKASPTTLFTSTHAHPASMAGAGGPAVASRGGAAPVVAGEGINWFFGGVTASNSLEDLDGREPQDLRAQGSEGTSAPSTDGKGAGAPAAEPQTPPLVTGTSQVANPERRPGGQPVADQDVVPLGQGSPVANSVTVPPVAGQGEGAAAGSVGSPASGSTAPAGAGATSDSGQGVGPEGRPEGQPVAGQGEGAAAGSVGSPPRSRATSDSGQGVGPLGQGSPVTDPAVPLGGGAPATNPQGQPIVPAPVEPKNYKAAFGFAVPAAIVGAIWVWLAATKQGRELLGSMRKLFTKKGRASLTPQQKREAIEDLVTLAVTSGLGVASGGYALHSARKTYTHNRNLPRARKRPARSH